MSQENTSPSASDLLPQVQAAMSSGQLDRATDLVRQAIALGGGPVSLWQSYFEIALHLADEDASLECAKHMARAEPGEPRHLLLLAERYSRVGDARTALTIVRQVAKTAPPNPAIDYFSGVYAGQLGALDIAAEQFRAALIRKPDFGDAWAMLQSAVGLRADEAERLQKLATGASASMGPGGYYALGNHAHGLGEAETAWHWWTKANRFEADKGPIDTARMIEGMEAVRAGEDSLPPVSGAPETSGATPRPVFVVGLPRSGTTLLEQALGAHETVRAMGETIFSRLATWPLGDLSPQSLEQALARDPAPWPRFGNAYRALARVRSGDAAVVTDKAVMLHLYVGVLARMLPDARFVWVRREPRDVVLSCYRAYLTGGNRWRHTPGDAFAYVTAQETLMTYWSTRLPDRVTRIDYETFARDPVGGRQLLADAAGLSSLPERPPEGDQPGTVATASFAQVRKPVSTSSIRTWERYARWLEPVFS